MSDDYHDDDSRSGGLWDPDAHTSPPPAPARPTLRVIESNGQEQPASAHGLVAGSGETLVRLDQFRPVEPDEPSSRHPRVRRRGAALAAAVLTIAAVVVAASTIGTGGKNQAPPTTANRLSTDTEQAALVRKVAPRPKATKHPRRSQRAVQRTSRRATPHGATSSAKQVQSAPNPPTQQPRPQTTTASKPKRKLRQYETLDSDTTTPELTQPVAASSEFGFEN